MEGVTVLMPCQDDGNMNCVELQSRFIHEVLPAKQAHCKALSMTESLIHPTQNQYPAKISDKLYLVTSISNAIAKKG